MKRRAPDEPQHPPNDSAYETDFVRWIERQVALLRAQQFEQLDLDNVIEEFEAMGLPPSLPPTRSRKTSCKIQPSCPDFDALGRGGVKSRA